MDSDPIQRVDRLIDDVSRAPSELPLVAITDLHNSGHDVRIKAGDGRFVAFITRRRDERLGGLTAREQQVATVIAAGYTNRQIAVALGIALGTVKDHVHSILAKTGFESRSQLIAAWYGGLTGPSSTEAPPS